MDSFYFAVPEGDLFAAYHPPKPGFARQSAVLLCCPLGHEYLNSHRAFRQIAIRLSELGYPVLRFDYFGCGDSGGGPEKATLDLWLSNVTQAAAQLKTRSQAARLCLLGVRFGAAMAMTAAAKLGSVDSLVLWDPVVDGNSYLRELKAFHKQVLDLAEANSRGVVRPPAYDGLSLFGFGPHLVAELSQIDVLSIGGTPAKQILLIESTAESANGHLSGRLRQWGANVDYRRLPGDESWKKNFDTVLLPGQVLPAVVNWVSEVCS
jgi:pimeloyl-ACP methyl ester carboxylesterase